MENQSSDKKISEFEEIMNLEEKGFPSDDKGFVELKNNVLTLKHGSNESNLFVGIIAYIERKNKNITVFTVLQSGLYVLFKTTFKYEENLEAFHKKLKKYFPYNPKESKKI